MRLARVVCVACLTVLLTVSLPLRAANRDDDGDRGPIKRVLLISVDGMHALDLSNYVHAHPNSTLAKLSKHGKTFTNASTSQPSDSFPGLASLVTGGSPITTGFWYDVTWNRALSFPKVANRSWEWRQDRVQALAAQ